MSLKQEKIYEVDVEFKDSDGKPKVDTIRVVGATVEEAGKKALEWIAQQQQDLEEEIDDYKADTDHRVAATRFVDMVVV